MTERFIDPRRFSECFQMNADNPGTLAQQQAVRDALAVEFGSLQHRLLQKVDQRINRKPWPDRRFLPIAFLNTTPFLAHAGASGLSLSELLVPEGILWIVPHEFGHVYEQLDLWTQEDKSWYMAELSPTDRDWTHFSETFADSYRDWWRGVGWDSLTPRLLRAA